MKEAITRNPGTKIISLVIAVLLWIFINGLIDPVTTKVIKNLPVTLLNAEQMESVNKIFEVTSGDTITIKIQGKRSVIEDLSADDFLATADITTKNELNAVEIVVTCTTHEESEVEIIEKKTSEGTGMMKLTLEDSDTQSFAVSVIPDGTVLEGNYITETSVSPNLITILGSKTQIAKIAKIAVLVNVEGVSNSFQQTSIPVVYDENGNVVDSVKLTMSAEQVQVNVTLLPTKSITLNVLKTGTAFYDYACTGIEYAPNTVLIAGKAAALMRISSLELFCDISNARADIEEELDIEAALQEQYGETYILVGDNDKVSVKATIVKMETKEISVLTSMIELKNLEESLTAEFSAISTSVKVVGVPAYLTDITVSQLTPYIDCSAFTAPGTYLALVRAEAPDNVETKVTTIEITISEKQDLLPISEGDDVSAPENDEPAEGEAGMTPVPEP